MTDVGRQLFWSGPAHIDDVNKLQGRRESNDPSPSTDPQRHGGLGSERHIGAGVICPAGSDDGVAGQIGEPEAAGEASAVRSGDFPPRAAGTSASGLTPWLKLDGNVESLPTRTVS